MKPKNDRPDLLIEDGEPVRCCFMFRTEAPYFWERCEQNATERITTDEVVRWQEWLKAHPKAIMGVYNGFYIEMCDTHLRHWREAVS